MLYFVLVSCNETNITLLLHDFSSRTDWPILIIFTLWKKWSVTITTSIALVQFLEIWRFLVLKFSSDSLLRACRNTGLYQIYYLTSWMFHFSSTHLLLACYYVCRLMKFFQRMEPKVKYKNSRRRAVIMSWIKYYRLLHSSKIRTGKKQKIWSISKEAKKTELYESTYYVWDAWSRQSLIWNPYLLNNWLQLKPPPIEADST